MSKGNAKGASHAANLASKRERAENAYSRAYAVGASPLVLAIAGSGRNAESGRGTIVSDVFSALYDKSGKPNGKTEAFVKLNDACTAADIRILCGANESDRIFRADLTGHVVERTDKPFVVRVRYATREEMLQAVKLAALVSGRTEAEVASVTGLRLPRAVAAAPSKALPAPSKAAE